MKRILGLVFGSFAILLIVVPENTLPETDAIPWILLSCLGSAFYSIEVIVIATKLPKQISPIGVSCIGNFFTVFFLFPLLCVSGQQRTLEWPPDKAGLAIFGISLISAIAYTLYLYVIKLASVSSGAFTFTECPTNSLVLNEHSNICISRRYFINWWK